MPSNLAPVYLDDARVQLQGDPRPLVAKIVAASGKPAPNDMRIVRVNAPGETEGETVQLQDVIERSEQGGPVYLRLVANPETGETEVTLGQDESTGIGSTPTAPKETFGAGHRGIAGQGATSSPGNLPVDKQAKSDFDPTAAPDRGGAEANREASNISPGQRRGERPQRSREGVGSKPASDDDASASPSDAD